MKTYIVMRDSPNDGSQNMFLGKNIDYYPKIIPVTPSCLERYFRRRDTHSGEINLQLSFLPPFHGESFFNGQCLLL